MSIATGTGRHDAAEHQKWSSLAPGWLRSSAAGSAPLYEHYWPPVPEFESLDPELRDFISAPAGAQESILAGLRGDHEAHGRLLHTHLGSIYTNWFGYRDSPFDRGPRDAEEIEHFRAKIRLERELFDRWVEFRQPLPGFTDQLAAADHLDELSASNPGVDHPLFAYLRDHASRKQLELFLQWEVIRNWGTRWPWLSARMTGWPASWRRP